MELSRCTWGFGDATMMVDRVFHSATFVGVIPSMDLQKHLKVDFVELQASSY